MADTGQLILDGLSRAATDPAGMPLHGGKKAPGLFAATAVGKQAAQRCKDDGLLCVVGTSTHGKSKRETVALTEKGLAYLLSQGNPRKVLEDLVRVLEARQAQTGELLSAAQRMQDGFNALKATAERVLQQVQRPAQPKSIGPVRSGNGSDTWVARALAMLARWQASGALEDCPLPELYRAAHDDEPSLSIGHFHDGLRRLHEQEKIYLHPWTGPLYDIPEPPYALMIGHEITYYASLRK